MRYMILPYRFIGNVLNQKYFVLFFYINIIIFSYFFIDKNLALYFDKTGFFNNFFQTITFFGRSELYLLGSLSVLILYKKYKKVALSLFLSVLFSGLTVDILKIVFGRYRPNLFLEKGLYGFDWFHIQHNFISFPSGHAVTAFSAFAVLGHFFPKGKLIFWIIALLTAFSRVVLNAHYLSDVIAGVITGIFCSKFIIDKV